MANQPDVIHYEGTVTHVWDDGYDFEPGKSEADDMWLFQKHRSAKPFDFGGRWTQIVSGTVDIRNGEMVNPQIKWTDQVEDHDE